MNNSFYANLHHYGFLSIIGPDTVKFLQGQTTCDVAKISTELATLGAYCTPKGRMICSFLAASPAENTIYLRMRQDICASSLAVLSKYIVFSKADIADASEQLKAYGFYGAEAATWLKGLFGSLPAARFGSVSAEDKTLIQIDEAGEQFELWLKADNAANDLANCTVTEGTTDDWTTINIHAGIGDVCAATQEEFIPQMLNMDITGAVSFSKGCYTGQEVVARMHYRGKSKRRMYSAQFIENNTANNIAEGAVVHIDGESQAVGHVVQVSNNAALLVLTEEAAKQSKLQLGDQTVALSFTPLPYAVDEGKE